MGALAVNLMSSGVGTFGITAGSAAALAWGAFKVTNGWLALPGLVVLLFLGVRPSDAGEMMILDHLGVGATALAETIFTEMVTPIEVQDVATIMESLKTASCWVSLSPRYASRM